MKKSVHALVPLIGLALVFFMFVSPLQAESPDTLYDEQPNVEQCEPGELQEDEKEAVLEALNRIRRLHNLEPITYTTDYDQEMAQASLMIVANNRIAHRPPRSFDCYSETGARGASSSNLSWSFPIEAEETPLLAPSATDIRDWLIDPDVPDLGHRRWLLNPFLQRTSYGRVDGSPTGRNVDQYAHGAALKVSGDSVEAPPDSAPRFVAYPYGEYPVDLFQIGWYWSFSVVADPSDYWNNEAVDFDDAAVHVHGAEGEQRVHSLASDNDAVGLPNFLKWQVDDVEMGQTYQVRIEDVWVQGEPQTYTYEVTLTEPDLSALDLRLFQLDTFDEELTVRSGEEFALFAPPSAQIPSRYTLSQPNIDVKMAKHSPYVQILRIKGSMGDEVGLSFDQGTVTLRIGEAADGGQETVTTLRRDLEMPVYSSTGQGETFTVTAGSRFAVYIPPETMEQGLRRVRWTRPRDMRLDIEFHNPRVLLVEVVEARPGSQATVRFGADKSFHIRISSPGES